MGQHEDWGSGTTLTGLLLRILEEMIFLAHAWKWGNEWSPGKSVKCPHPKQSVLHMCNLVWKVSEEVHSLAHFIYYHIFFSCSALSPTESLTQGGLSWAGTHWWVPLSCWPHLHVALLMVMRPRWARVGISALPRPLHWEAWLISSLGQKACGPFTISSSYLLFQPDILLIHSTELLIRQLSTPNLY
jgi:hypothetical protein